MIISAPARRKRSAFSPAPMPMKVQPRFRVALTFPNAIANKGEAGELNHVLFGGSVGGYAYDLLA
jgi:hypothetical protein